MHLPEIPITVVTNRQIPQLCNRSSAVRPRKKIRGVHKHCAKRPGWTRFGVVGVQGMPTQLLPLDLNMPGRVTMVRASFTGPW